MPKIEAGRPTLQEIRDAIACRLAASDGSGHPYGDCKDHGRLIVRDIEALIRAILEECKSSA